MLNFMQAGGFLMWPLLLLSVGALAIIVERFLSLRLSRLMPDNVLLQAKQCLQDPQRHPWQALSEGSALGYILSRGLLISDSSMDVIQAKMEEAGRYVMHRLENYLSLLASIAMVSPLIGLLGTVLGMITVFSSLMQGGAGDPQALSSGIASALLTTAAGLMIAIPSTVAHRYFERHLEVIAVQLAQQSQLFLACIEKQRRSLSKNRAPLEKVSKASWEALV